MSYTNDPPNNIAYDPIPDEHPPTDIPYNAPIHEPPSLSYGTPQPGSSELIHDDDLPPSGVAPPRFFGSALYSEVGAPGTRNSHYSSPSQAPTIRGSVYSGSGSVYALNTRPYDSQVFEDGYRDDPYLAGNQGGMSLDPVGRNRYLQEKNATYARPTAFPRRRVIYWIAFIIILLIVAVGLPVYFAVIRPKENSSGSGSMALCHLAKIIPSVIDHPALALWLYVKIILYLVPDYPALAPWLYVKILVYIQFLVIQLWLFTFAKIILVLDVS